METFESFEEVLYRVNDNSFEEIALELFHFQAKFNPVYSEYIHHLRIKPNAVRSIDQIPYLPVGFFKNHDIKTGNWTPQVTFTSSGTTGMVTSKHAVHSLSFYLENAAQCFSFFYGDPADYRTLALLPSYVERDGSSLIAMIEDFIRRGSTSSRNTLAKGGFYHNNRQGLLDAIARHGEGKMMLWGVTYALLDLAEEIELDLSNCIVFETGGMKGRRAEITRTELHAFLGTRFHTHSIHSEYGMTELMSQAYSDGEGIFRCPPWMKVVLRDPEDPRDVSRGRQRGGINVIDLANIRTCAFIETQDLGKMALPGDERLYGTPKEERFEVLGRMDNSDIRGCNLLVE